MDKTAHLLYGAGLPFTRLPAANGQELPAKLGAEAINHLGRELLAGEIGCFQSHLNAARAFLESDAKLGLVIEDDVTLFPEFKNTLKAFLAKLDRFSIWDVVNLGQPAKRWRTPVHAAVWDGPGILCHAYQFPVTTTALLWSRGGAQVFLSQNAQMRLPVNVQLQEWVSKTGRGLAFTKPPFGT